MTTLIELIGLGLVLAGCWMLAPWVGLIAAGLALVAISNALEVKRDDPPTTDGRG